MKTYPLLIIDAAQAQDLDGVGPYIATEIMKVIAKRCAVANAANQVDAQQVFGSATASSASSSNSSSHRKAHHPGTAVIEKTPAPDVCVVGKSKKSLSGGGGSNSLYSPEAGKGPWALITGAPWLVG